MSIRFLKIFENEFSAVRRGFSSAAAEFFQQKAAKSFKPL
jgi:hypothetical protein